MRTTLTLDEDLAAALRQRAAATGPENQAALCSNDADFARFPGLNWVNPLA